MTQGDIEKLLDKSETAAPLMVNSRSLFGGKKEVLILHEGATYKLKITRFGKLILNK
ncbi:hemin uptake protein HemP [uncultured Bartonella sp.]|uniref:hemin uptake protein HemP n=1 Tax=uncultured Bartonella sp. TaxID=104108 RepID=UPI00263141B2|nr:hemin uptake protein HemP [uncultured Bartonella sp.]